MIGSPAQRLAWANRVAPPEACRALLQRDPVASRAAVIRALIEARDFISLPGVLLPFTGVELVCQRADGHTTPPDAPDVARLTGFAAVQRACRGDHATEAVAIRALTVTVGAFWPRWEGGDLRARPCLARRTPGRPPGEIIAAFDATIARLGGEPAFPESDSLQEVIDAD